jgi:integrase
VILSPAQNTAFQVSRFLCSDHLITIKVEAVQMSSPELGPEWVLSSFTSNDPDTRYELDRLIAAARRLWPRIQAHAMREQTHKSSGSLFRAHLKPALEAAEIPGNVGWHTLRHTFGTLMKANGEDIKTIQELLRHSNYKVTADTYTQAVTSTKRAAQTKLVKMTLLPR